MRSKKSWAPTRPRRPVDTTSLAATFRSRNLGELGECVATGWRIRCRSRRGATLSPFARRATSPRSVPPLVPRRPRVMPIRPKTFTLLCAAAFVPGLALYAQQPAPAAKEEPRTKTEQKEAPKREAAKSDVEKIIDEGTNRSQVMKTLGYLSDVIGPRLTGSPGLKRANEWTRDQLKGYGLENAAPRAVGPLRQGLDAQGLFGRGRRAALHPPDRVPQGLVARHPRPGRRRRRLPRREHRQRLRPFQGPAPRQDRPNEPDPAGRGALRGARHPADRRPAARPRELPAARRGSAPPSPRPAASPSGGAGPRPGRGLEQPGRRGE